MLKNKKSQSLIQLALFFGIIVFVNILSSYIYKSADLTEEGRFTLTQPTKELMDEIDDILYIQVLLDGDFPAGFKRLQTATKELLDDFRSVNGNVEYEFLNPGEGTIQEVNERKKVLANDGIIPTVLRVKQIDETVEQIIYPWAIINYKGRSVPINLLENEALGVSDEVILNNSVSLLEYKFTSGITRVRTTKKPAILFTTGHGELEAIQTLDLHRAIYKKYNVGQINLDSIIQIADQVKTLVIAKPKTRFTSRDKFLIDQYVMRGGNVMFLIDQLGVNLDSLRMLPRFIPRENNLGLEDMLFNYGVKVKPNLILDLECTQIPLVTGQLGDGPQYDFFPWYYHPVVAPTSAHPIVKNLERINFQFPSSIDTFRTKTPIKKTVILTSSKYTKLQRTPIELNFEILRQKPKEDFFNKPPQPIAVLLEGVFPSLYENRVPQQMLEGLESMGQQYVSKGKPAKMLVVSDGDVVRNLIVDMETQKVKTLGFNPYDKRIYGNKNFIINALEYLIDNSGVMESRSKEVKLRMIDTTRARTEKTKWQVVNIVLPLVFLLTFGFLYNYVRRRKYG